MLDFLLELGGDLIDWIGDLFESGVDAVTSVDTTGIIDGVASVVSDAFLIGSALYVVSLTADTIKSELQNRRELKDKGVTHVIIQEFIQSSGYTEVSLAALNSQNQQVGTVKMKTNDASRVHKGQKIYI